MERRRFIIPMVIMTSIVGIVVFVFFMFYKNVFIFNSQEEAHVSSAVPTAVVTRCPSCAVGTMSRSEYIAPTCTAAGSETMKCDSCGNMITGELPALGHSVVTDEAVAASCTATGLTEGSHCSRCDTVLEEQETVPALGHSWSDWEDSRTSCDEVGIRTRSCSICGEEETEELSAGTHTWDNGTVTKQPDCTQSGIMEFTCILCGDTSTADIDPLGHNLRHYAAVDPTEDKDGNIEYWECTRCGKYFSDKSGVTEISFSDITVPYGDDTTDTDGMPAWQVIIAVSCGVILLGVVAVLLDKFVFSAGGSRGK